MVFELQYQNSSSSFSNQKALRLVLVKPTRDRERSKILLYNVEIYSIENLD